MSASKRRRLSGSALNYFIEELKGIKDELPLGYMETDYGDDEDEGAEPHSPAIESEDVEILITSLISDMSKKCGLADEPDDLAGLMGALFSGDDDLVGLAANLEDSINGYFGSLFGEDLQMARTYFLEIIEGLQAKEQRWKEKKLSDK